jgi:tripartite-type tricarboxylate transporter receptor subunit TctC
MALTLSLVAGVSHSAEYPEKSVELPVPWAAGGGTDAVARAFAETAKKHMSQPVVVTDRPGATGSIGFGEVARGTPDGYKVAVLTAELLVIPTWASARSAMMTSSYWRVSTPCPPQ